MIDKKYLANPEAAAPRQWQNRIVGEGEEDARQLLANPGNWRIHSGQQQKALGAVLDEVGWVQRVIVNKRTGRVVDGHLRVALAISKGERVPVVYIDVSEAEERLILATIDPLSAMAGTDEDLLAALRGAMLPEHVDIAELCKDPIGESAMPDLPSGDKSPFQQMTFTLHDSQAEQVTAALKAADALGPYAGSPNENGNGNALARICETFLTEHGNG
jgi:hypothetical protein